MHRVIDMNQAEVLLVLQKIAPGDLQCLLIGCEDQGGNGGQIGQICFGDKDGCSKLLQGSARQSQGIGCALQPLKCWNSLPSAVLVRSLFVFASASSSVAGLRNFSAFSNHLRKLYLARVPASTTAVSGPGHTRPSISSLQSLGLLGLVLLSSKEARFRPRDRWPRSQKESKFGKK